MVAVDFLPDTELIFWVGGPCVLGFGLIWCVTTCCVTSSSSSFTARPKRRKLVRKDSGHPFLGRSGLLDGGTPYLKSWSTNVVQTYTSNHAQNGYFDFDASSSALQKSVFRGWYNIAMLLIVSYIALHFISNYNTFGTLISNTAFLYSLVLELHELIIVVLLVYFASFSVHFNQRFALYFSRWLLEHMERDEKEEQPATTNKKHVHNNNNNNIQSLISRAKAIHLVFAISSYVCITFILTVTTLFVYYRTRHWPWSQKAGLMLETVCLTLKAHSYVDTNNELFAWKLKQFQRKHDQKHVHKTATHAHDLPDITMLSDIENLSDHEIESYLLAYGLKKNWLFSSSKEEQKKLLLQIRNQLILRNSIYPKNVTLWDFILFSCHPTLCYSPIYPRTGHESMDAASSNLRDNIQWIYVIEKFIMALGIMVCMYLITETFVVPILSKSNEVAYADAVIRLYFPFFCIFILGFFLVFDCILNASAELTCFADRQFYSDWWNSTSFMEFSRKWNMPVHEYLLRHVYLGMFVKRMGCSATMAKALTFIWSTVFHEIVLAATTHQFKPWFTFFSLWQLPLMPVMESPMFRNTQLGNIITLCFFILGVGMIALLYARDYVVLLQDEEML